MADQIKKLAQIGQLRFERSLVEQNKAEAILQQKAHALSALEAIGQSLHSERYQHQRARAEARSSENGVAKYIVYLSRVISSHELSITSGKTDVTEAEEVFATAKRETLTRLRRIKKLEKLSDSMQSFATDDS